MPFGNIKMRMVVADFLTEVRFSYSIFDSTRQFSTSCTAPPLVTFVVLFLPRSRLQQGDSAPNYRHRNESRLL